MSPPVDGKGGGGFQLGSVARIPGLKSGTPRHAGAPFDFTLGFVAGSVRFVSGSLAERVSF